MIITDSSIQMTAQHQYQESFETREHLTVWQTGHNRQNQINNENGKKLEVDSIIANQEAAARIHLSRTGRTNPGHIKGMAEELPEDKKDIADLKIKILKALIERIFGKKIEINDPGKEIERKMKEAEQRQQDLADPGVEVPAEQTAGYGLIYEYSETYQEVEKTRFTAEGIVHTADGKEVIFTSSLSMSREYLSEKNVSIRAGDALKDPIVVNFNGQAAELTEDTFDFDLDNDGSKDQISFVGPGSGFLALDRNRDGQINDGTELFGAQTGDGFAELSRYDEDRNNWIDENDSIYQDLRIWMLDGSGDRKLFSLAEKGIGAIYLEHMSTPFSLKNQENVLQAQIRSTGMFLFEDGKVGNVQQIDLVV